MPDRYFVFRRGDETPIFGLGSDRDAAHYLAHLNRTEHRYSCRPTSPPPSGRVLLLALALADIVEAAE